MVSALVAAFLIVPIVEIAVIVKVGSIIGPWWTVLLLLVESAIGAWIVKREGLRAWQGLSTAIRTGHLPSRELADAALVLMGGVLLLTPGFVTDVFGFLFVLPVTRPLVRSGLFAVLASRYRALGALGMASSAARFAGSARGRRRPSGRDSGVRGGGTEGSATGQPGEAGRQRGRGPRIVPGEVVSDGKHGRSPDRADGGSTATSDG
ncbi:MAG: FxsA family protein [Actinomycetes bacterium]